MALRWIDSHPGAWLAEHYAPASRVDDLRATALRLQSTADTMTGAGDSVRFVTVAIVPVDEAMVCVVEAASEALVRRAWRRAGVRLDRLTPALLSVPGETQGSAR